ncbi:MAG: serpin family protein [Gemmatimonadetes bacterium]|nr:serpin family protein [Gemmatimonadota bacterium]
MATVAGAAFLLASCELLSGPGEDMPLERLPRDLSAAEQAIIASSNTFAFDLLRETASTEVRPDIMLSPLSASMALGMAMNGARGPTFTGMRDALAFGSLDQESINTSYRDLMQLLLGLDDAVDMRIANSVWARSNFTFHDSFIETVRHWFGAEATSLDFAATDAAPTINRWVDRSTNGRISEIVPDPIPGDAVMYLINAIYFKGDWRESFDRELTRDAPFTRADGSTKTVAMMAREGGFDYYANADAEVAELRYGRGAFVMNIVLPREGRTADELIATLDEARWNSWIGGLTPSEMHLTMPKFRLEYETTMNNALIALGMESAFGAPDTDFTGLSPHGRDLYISDVKQKTFINVDEVGTEAAAVTSVEVRVTSMPPTMMVNRPFLVVIRERFGGAILFIGKIGDPEVQQ